MDSTNVGLLILFVAALIGFALHYFFKIRPEQKLADGEPTLSRREFFGLPKSADFDDIPGQWKEFIPDAKENLAPLFEVNQAWADEKDEFQNDAVDDLNELFEEMNEGKRAVNAQADAIDNHADHIEGLLEDIDSIGDFCNQLESVVVFEHADRIEDLQEDVASLDGTVIGLNTRILELEFLSLAERIAALEAKADLPQLKIIPVPPYTYPNPGNTNPWGGITYTNTANAPAPIDLDEPEVEVEYQFDSEEIAFAASQERLAKALADRKAASAHFVQDFDRD